MKTYENDTTESNPEISLRIDKDDTFEEKSSFSNFTNVSLTSDYQKKVVIRDIDNKKITIPYDTDLENERMLNFIANRGVKSEPTSDK